MSAEQLPPPDRVGLSKTLAACAPDRPLPTDLSARAWNAFSALTLVIQSEKQIQLSVNPEASKLYRAGLQSQLENAELACRMFAAELREAAREQ